MVTRASSRSSSLRPLVAIAVTVLFGFSAACRNQPLTAPSGTAITLVATTNVLPVNGSTDITAVLIEGGVTASGDDDATVTPGVGTPVHNGTLVLFTTTIGRIEPAEAKTENGRVTVRLVGDGRSGKATVTAFSGPASKTLEVNIGAAAAASIVLSASPTTLGAAGGSSTITARVSDAQGNGLQGVPVSFTTTKGSVSPISAMSNEQGNATTVLTTTEAAEVTGSSGGAEGAITGKVPVSIAANLTLSIVPTTPITVSVPATITVKPPTAASGAAPIVIKDVSIDMGDGTVERLGAISGETVFQHLFAAEGVLQMRGTITDAANNSTTVTVPVVVGPLAPTVALAAGSSLKANTLINFEVKVPTNALISAYEWDFGDGTGKITTQTPNLSHSFVAAGPAIVRVRVVPLVGPAKIAELGVTITP